MRVSELLAAARHALGVCEALVADNLDMAVPNKSS